MQWIFAAVSAAVIAALAIAIALGAPVAARPRRPRPKSRKEQRGRRRSARRRRARRGADYSKEFRKLAGPRPDRRQREEVGRRPRGAARARGAPGPTHDDLQGDRDLAPAGDAGRRRPGCFRGSDRDLPRDGLRRRPNVGADAPAARRPLQREEGQRQDTEHFQAVRGCDAGRAEPDEFETLGTPDLQAGHDAEGASGSARRSTWRRAATRSPRKCGSSCATAAS